MNFIKEIKKIIKDDKGQLSLEFLLILGILIIGAILVGYYMKQVAAKNAAKSKVLQKNSLNNTT